MHFNKEFYKAIKNIKHIYVLIKINYTILPMIFEVRTE